MINVLLGNVPLKPDTVITNYDGQRVWLKEAFYGTRRIGVAACCPEQDPCSWHEALSRAVK